MEPARRLAPRAGCTSRAIEHLLRRYGSRFHELLDEIAERPALGEPLEGADDYLRVEVRYAASHEGALHLDDVLARRTRISIETFDRGLAAAEPAARLMGEVLGWSEATTPARSSSTASAWRPSATRRSSPTTRPPTWRARARRTSPSAGRARRACGVVPEGSSRPDEVAFEGPG